MDPRSVTMILLAIGVVCLSGGMAMLLAVRGFLQRIKYKKQCRKGVEKVYLFRVQKIREVLNYFFELCQVQQIGGKGFFISRQKEIEGLIKKLEEASIDPKCKDGLIWFGSENHIMMNLQSAVEDLLAQPSMAQSLGEDVLVCISKFMRGVHQQNISIVDELENLCSPVGVERYVQTHKNDMNRLARGMYSSLFNR